MNIRGTDASALASVTDIFMAVTPARDEVTADDFQKALQPPVRPAIENEQSSRRPVEEKDSKYQTPVPCRSAEPPAATRKDAPPEQQHETKESSSGSEALAASGERTNHQTDEELTQEDDAAEVSLATAANLAAEQKIVEPPVPQTDAAIVVSELHSTKIADEPVAEQAETSVSIPQNPIEINAAAELQPTQSVKDATAGTETETAEQVLPDLSVKHSSIESVEAAIEVVPSANAQKTIEAKLDSRANDAASTQFTGEAADGKHKTSTKTANTAEYAENATADAATEAPADALPPPEDQTGFEKGSRRPALESREQTTPIPTAIQPADNLPSPPPTATETTPVAAPVSSTEPLVSQPGDRVASPSPQQPLPAAAIVQRLPAHALVRNTSAQPAPLHVDSARFLQRVARAFESARERDGEIRLRLSPPELGALRVEVQMQEQGLVAKLEVETTDARNILLENLPALRERLAEQGLRLERFDVELSQRESSQQGGELPDQPPDRQPHSTTRQAKTIAAPQTTPAAPQPLPTPASGWQDRQLNVIV